VAPVTVRNRLTAFLMLGQFRIDGDPVPEWIGQIEDEHQRKRMLDNYESLASFSRARLNGIIGLFRSLIDYVVIRELAVLQEDRLYDNIVSYIRGQLRSEIKLPDMARKLGKSVSTLSQYLRKKHGTSFKSLVTEFRLELVDQFIKEHPDSSIAEIAAASGYKYQFYLSRIFKKQRGIAPGVYREQFRGRR
ncbi:MAG: helix-turn-helix domain-containing protein, partial [Victivallaceae bacterium]|nr:helix-turn-helix domain-containing protein [Victivallaceae bacterium]